MRLLRKLLVSPVLLSLGGIEVLRFAVRDDEAMQERGQQKENRSEQQPEKKPSVIAKLNALKTQETGSSRKPLDRGER